MQILILLEDQVEEQLLEDFSYSIQISASSSEKQGLGPMIRSLFLPEA